MKYGNVYYFEHGRSIFNDENYLHLSAHACWMFTVLNELEHRFISDKDDFFFRSDKDLAKDCRLSESTIKRAKKELLKTDLVESWQMHYIDTKTGKKSEKKVTAYRILK